MKKIKATLQLSLILFFAIACSKDDSSIPEIEQKRDVYVLGIDNFETPSATINLWKNGEVTNKIPADKSGANCLFVSNLDTYIGGYEKTGLTNSATIWKNGVATYLTDGKNTASITDVHVVNNDVYAVGAESGINGLTAELWKNGEVMFSAEGAGGSAAFNSIDVVGSDIYIAGFTSEGGRRSVPKVWHNGRVLESNFKTDVRIKLRDIKAVGLDIYVIGYEYDTGVKKAAVWKNGTATYLTDGKEHADVTSLFVNNGDVYVTGYEVVGNGTVARLWKNGEVINVVKESSIGDSEANGVFVKDNNVYVAFSEFDNATERNVVKLWKNGEVSVVSDNKVNAYVIGLFVE